MDYNFHTHTHYCGHASGRTEDYVLRAIEGGIRYMGFSDHIPFRCPDGYEAIGTRVPIARAQEYYSELAALREKYRDQIEIHVGFESEYYPQHFDQMVADARSYGAEYLILGQHFLKPEHPDGVHSFFPTDDATKLTAYADSLVAAIKTGAFTYIAHPDIFQFTGDDAVFRDAMRRVCIASREHSVPLEINFYGIRDHRHYPRSSFWKVAGEEHCPVTFGFDAHTVASAFDGDSIPVALDMVTTYGLNYIGKPTLISI